MTKTRPNLTGWKYKDVKLKDGIGTDYNGQNLEGETFQIEAYYDELFGSSWLDTNFDDMNFVTYMYVMRKGYQYDSNDEDVDWVVYGHIGGLGHLVHIKEIENWEDLYGKQN